MTRHATRRGLARTGALALAASLAGLSAAGTEPAPSPQQGAPRDAVPDPAQARAETLDTLFVRLKQAEGPEAARPIEAAILAVLGRSGSPSIDLIMTRGLTLMRDGDLDGALALYTKVTELKPDFAAGWRQRGIVQARRGEGADARDDLRKALDLEPRDIAAMSNLGNVLEQMGNADGALRLYRQLLALDPHVEGVAQRAERLRVEVEGRGI